MRHEFPSSDPDIIEDWAQCVQSFTVSSKESTALNLFEPIAGSCWQSSGPQGKVSSFLTLLFIDYNFYLFMLITIGMALLLPSFCFSLFIVIALINK